MIYNIYLSQKQLPRKTKSRLVITEYAGYIFWQLFCGDYKPAVLARGTLGDWAGVGYWDGAAEEG